MNEMLIEQIKSDIKTFYNSNEVSLNKVVDINHILTCPTITNWVYDMNNKLNFPQDFYITIKFRFFH